MQHIDQIIILFQLRAWRHILRQKELLLAQMPPTGIAWIILSVKN